MSEFESVFDNSGTSPALEGQGQYEGTETQIQEETTPPEVEETQSTEGQGVEQQAAEQQEVDYKALYEQTKKAYDNIRPAYTKATQELSKFKQTSNTQSVQQPIQPVVTDPQADPQQRQVASFIENIVQQAVAPLKQQQAELVMQNEVAKFKAVTKDFDEQAPKMYEILETMPQLWNVGDVGTVLQTAYKLAKVDSIEAQIPELVAQAQNGAYANRVVKEINATDRTRPNPQQTAEKSPADLIKADILEEARKSQGSVF